jgi:pimeloyl-ACP methyl ester carboxylesterase
MPEPRGFGASDGDPRDSYISEISDADLLAVLDAADVHRAVLTVWSLAGSRMIHFAATHPDRVDSLILINTCAHYVREEDYPWGYPRERLDDVTSFLEGSWGSAADLKMTALSRMADERLRALWGRARRSSYGPHAYADALREQIEYDVPARLLLQSLYRLWSFIERAIA